LQSAGLVQQFACWVWTHWKFPVSQVSVVQDDPSLHSAAVVQHSGMAECVQVPPGSWQSSMVQRLPSSQSAGELQGPTACRA
jgi:hypothetical protein